MGPKDEFLMKSDGVDLWTDRDAGPGDVRDTGSGEFRVVWEMNLFLLLAKL